MKVFNCIFVITGCYMLLSCSVSTNPNDYADSEETSSIYDYKNYAGGEGTYYQDRGVLYRTIEEFDILPIPYIDRKYLNAGYSFDFYNYNGELQINNMVRPNIYANGISSEFILSIVKKDDVLHFHPNYSEEYGKWGYATILVGNMFIKDVVVTPLAVKYLSDPNNNGCLVFVRFEQNFGREYKDYLFCGDVTTEIIIDRYYEMIERKPSIWSRAGTNDWKSKR